MDIVNIIIFIVLIIFTAFFVAFEFAIVKVRPSRIEQLEAEGNKSAKYALTMVTHLDEYLSACQLGITVTALGLGWIGEPTVSRLIHPLIELLSIPNSVVTALSFGISFAIVTFLHVVIGELAPKTVAIQKAEQVTLVFARPMIIFYKIMYPFIKLLNGSARLLVRLFGFKPASEQEEALTEEELRLLLSKSYESGKINQSELDYVENIFEFDERIAREIMVPRTKVDIISLEDSKEEIEELLANAKYTRYPVSEDDDKDNIIGIINVKEVLMYNLKNNKLPNIEEVMYPSLNVMESTPIYDLLRLMQRKRSHMVVLMDEYGGTSGVITMEDIVEEIVGEIRDEFDNDEVSDIQVIGNNHYIMNGVVLLNEVNQLLLIDIDDENVDTLGGWMLTQKYDIKVDQEINYDNYTFKVKQMDGHQIDLVEIKKNASQ